MLKKMFFILSACVVAFAFIITLTACRNNNENDSNDPTPEERRAQFELFFEENKERIIETIATDGEDVRLELAEGYEFLMTILLDDIELNDDNRTLYVLTFELSFSQMYDLFSGLAWDIKEDAQINNFRLSVIFVDVNEEEIARSSFFTGSLAETIEEEYNEEIDY